MKREIEFVLSAASHAELVAALVRLAEKRDKGWQLVDVEAEETSDDKGNPSRLGKLIIEK